MGIQPYMDKRPYADAIQLRTEARAQWDGKRPYAELVRPYDTGTGILETLYPEQPETGVRQINSGERNISSRYNPTLGSPPVSKYSWVDYTGAGAADPGGNDKWLTTDSEWDGDVFVSTVGSDIQLAPAGDWSVAFKPVKLRVFGTLGGAGVTSMYDSDANELCSGSSKSGREFGIRWRPAYTDFWIFELFGYSEVRRIDFYIIAS